MAKGIKNTECKVILHRADDLVASRFVNVKKLEPESKDYWIFTSASDGTETNNKYGIGDDPALFGFNYLFLDEKDKNQINFRKQRRRYS